MKHSCFIFGFILVVAFVFIAQPTFMGGYQAPYRGPVEYVGRGLIIVALLLEPMGRFFGRVFLRQNTIDNTKICIENIRLKLVQKIYSRISINFDFVIMRTLWFNGFSGRLHSTVLASSRAWAFQKNVCF